MKKNLIIMSFIIIASFLLPSCQHLGEPIVGEEASNIQDAEEQALEEEDEIEENNDFAFLLKKDKSLDICIMDWGNNMDIEAVLGECLEEKNEIIGEGGDTFKGSKIKRLKYEGLDIDLMAPKGNNSYYIMTMTGHNQNYITPRNISVGDKLEKLLKVYPTIEKMEIWEKNNNAEIYRFTNEGFKYIDFYLTNGIINKIIIGLDLQ